MLWMWKQGPWLFACFQIGEQLLLKSSIFDASPFDLNVSYSNVWGAFCLVSDHIFGLNFGTSTEDCSSWKTLTPPKFNIAPEELPSQ